MDLSTIKNELYTFASPEEREGIKKASEIPELGEEILRNLHEKRKSQYPKKKERRLIEQQEKKWKDEKRRAAWHSGGMSGWENYRELQEILGYEMIDDCANGAHNKTFRFCRDVLPIIHKALVQYRESVIKGVKLEYITFPEDGEEVKIVEIDGVEYQHNTVDGRMIRTDDYSEVGTWNDDTGEIDFDEEEEEDVDEEEVKVVEIDGVEYRHHAQHVGRMVRLDPHGIHKEVGTWNDDTGEIDFDEDEDE
tara:strand:+ start:217 stop:966 length:750 start_codon:yes stop_codon:yes gene_type:complete